VPVGLGPRFLIEAGFLIAVAVVAGVERLSTMTIVLVMGAAWLLVALVEWFAARTRRRGAEPGAAAAARPVPVAKPEADVVSAPAPVSLQPEPQPAPPPDAEPEQIPEPEPAPEPHEAPPDERPEPVPAQPRVAAVPPPGPAPEPPPEPEPTVVAINARRGGPREWNLWDLERVARARAGGDAVRDEERSFLLMYLREFASADGVLPADFDAVVRESFGDVLDAAYS